MKVFRIFAPEGLVDPIFGGRKVPGIGLIVTEAEAVEVEAAGWRVEEEGEDDDEAEIEEQPPPKPRKTTVPPGGKS